MGNVSYTSRVSMSCSRSVCYCYTLPHVACRFVQRLRGLSSTPCSRICLVVRWVGSFFYKSRAGNCLVVRPGRRGANLSDTPYARVCQVFRRVGRLSFKPYTGIYLIGAGICLAIPRMGSLSYMPRPGICPVVCRVGSLS